MHLWTNKLGMNLFVNKAPSWFNSSLITDLTCELLQKATAQNVLMSELRTFVPQGGLRCWRASTPTWGSPTFDPGRTSPAYYEEGKEKHALALSGYAVLRVCTFQRAFFMQRLHKDEALHVGRSKEARSAKLSAVSSHRKLTVESTLWRLLSASRAQLHAMWNHPHLLYF